MEKAEFFCCFEGFGRIGLGFAVFRGFLLEGFVESLQLFEGFCRVVFLFLECFRKFICIFHVFKMMNKPSLVFPTSC